MRGPSTSLKLVFRFNKGFLLQVHSVTMTLALDSTGLVSLDMEVMVKA